MAAEFPASAEEVELDHKSESGHLAAESLDQLANRPGRPASGQYVVDNQNALARFNGVCMNLKCVVAILKRVIDPSGLMWEFAGFFAQAQNPCPSHKPRWEQT